MFVTGRGGAGFHSLAPAVERAGGVILWVVSAPCPIRGESPLIPLTGPRSAPPILNGDLVGEWAGPEAGAQNCEKNMRRPGPFSGAGRGKGPGAGHF